MAVERILQASFSAGELSPHLHDRVDLDAYGAGAAYLRNFIPLPHGPLLRRRGTHFIYEAAGSVVRLLPFTFNISQSFVLEFTNYKLRIFHKDGILLNGSGSILEISTPYAAADLYRLNWAQHGDWLYLVTGVHQPYVLKRFSNTNWTLTALTFTNQPSEWITGNYPKCVALYEQRAYYASTPNQPLRVWASRIGLYEDFTMTVSGSVLDDCAFTYDVFSDDTNGIEWLLPTKYFILGTAGAEHQIQSSSYGDPITPSNVRITTETHYGSAPSRAVVIGADVAFINRARNRLRTLSFSYYENQHVATDLTIYASHILEGRVKEMHVQTTPDSYIWMVTEDGYLVGCTYEKRQKVLAWHKHDTPGLFKSICILPGEENDRIYLAVERVVNGATKTYIEVLEDAWETADTVEKAFYVDSGLTYNGTPADEITGLSHLEGCTVSINVDGWSHPPVVVSNGAIQLQKAGSIIHIGLPYISDFRSLTPQSPQAVTVGSTRRISEIIVALEESGHFYYQVLDNAESVAYYGPTEVMDQAKEYKSRHERLTVECASAMTPSLRIWQDKPLPLIIRGLVYSINPKNV